MTQEKNTAALLNNASPASEDRRIFFTDLDGTLLDDKKRITDEVRLAIHKALSQGHPIVLASGRTLFSTRRLAEELDMMHPGCYLISFNGCRIYDIGKDTVLYASNISSDLVRFCFDEAEKYDIHIQAYHNEYVITEHDRSQIVPYCKVQRLPIMIVSRVENTAPEGSPKMLVIEDDPEKMQAFREHMSPLLKGKVDLFLSQKNYMEMVPCGVNKGTAVRFLCSHLNIPISSSVAAGDMENDLTMIKAAGIGAVMCNGSDAVKKYADYITERDNNHSGAAEIIERFILSPLS